MIEVAKAAVILATTLFVMAACTNSPETDEENAATFAEIAPSERIDFTGTEPFWGGHAVGDELTYSTPELIEGRSFAVERFAGNSGLGLSGNLDGRPFDMTVTSGECSDAMSDRVYPYTVTLQIGDDTRFGCAWTQNKPFSGAEAP